MRLAIPVWDGRVSPVFDVACRFLLVDVIGGEASFTEELEVTRADRVAVIAENGVNVVVCGAISHRLEERLLASGIEVVAEIRGSHVEVVRAYLEGALAHARFSMPGVHGRRRRPRNRGQRSLRTKVSESAPAVSSVET